MEQPDLFDSDDLIRVHPDIREQFTVDIRYGAAKMADQLMDRVMEAGLEAIRQSASMMNLNTQLSQLAQENGMTFDDLLQETDEYFELTTSLAHQALGGFINQLTRSFPHPLDSVNLNQIAAEEESKEL